MANLSFGTFTWPNDPECYEESCVREPVYSQTEDGRTVFSSMGPVKRTITGSGAFFGSNAYNSFKSLLALVSQEKPASLVHPIWGTRSVFLTELKSTMEPRENYVAYSFTFREADSSGAIPK